MLYGMATMYIRSTFALDEPTSEGLAKLAKKWGVSKSEALRRAVARAQEQPGPGGEMTPREALLALTRRPAISRSQARSWRAENARARRESDDAADSRSGRRSPRRAR
jgi:post-segregation antitoxin (ccd killing protein)